MLPVKRKLKSMHKLKTTFALACLLSLGAVAWCQTDERPPRAAPPTFNDKSTDGIFFDDALKEGLRGDRPANLGKKVDAGTAGVSGLNGSAEAGVSNSNWSQLISATTIEDTIKSTKFALDKTVTQPAAFASGGNRKARQAFVRLTTMFAIVSEYDGDIRWKSDAIIARDRCRNAAQVCKVGSVQAFNAAKAAKDDLADLISGNRLGNGEKGANQWEQLVDRSSLMKELDRLFEEQIKPGVSNNNEFKAKADQILIASELAAVYAEILLDEEMEDATDDEYSEYGKNLKKGAMDIIAALRQSNGKSARTAAGVMGQACSECHGTFQ